MVGCIGTQSVEKNMKENIFFLLCVYVHVTKNTFFLLIFSADVLNKRLGILSCFS